MIDNYQAVLFDFDGVIGNTLEDNYQAWAHVFKQFNAVIDREEYFLMEGRRSIDIIRHFLIKNGLAPDLAPEILRRKHEYYAAHNRFSTYAGVEEVVALLKAAAIKTAVVSGGSAKRLLSPPSNSVLPMFDAVITGDECPNTKPAPDPYLLAAQKLNLPPRACLVVENAPLGIEAAKSAGMDCVALCSTLARRHLSRADHVLEDMEQFKVLLVKRRSPSDGEGRR